MKRLLGAVTLGLSVACGNVNANASVPLPVIEQASGIASLAPLLKAITPAVVSIAIRVAAVSKNSSPNKAQKAEPSASARNIQADGRLRASGSGVLIDSAEGIILTSARVIDGADEIVVTLAGGRELPAARIGADKATNVAVIKVTAPALPAVPIGNSDQLEVGDFVLAIGNPYVIGQTVTSGIVSALHRNKLGIEQYEDFIQTDAAIYPGNSGGALVNLRGELVGINTAFRAAGSTSPGMGLAIPINMVRSAVDQILKPDDRRREREATGGSF